MHEFVLPMNDVSSMKILHRTVAKNPNEQKFNFFEQKKKSKITRRRINSSCRNIFVVGKGKRLGDGGTVVGPLITNGSKDESET